MSHVSTLPRNEIDFLGHMFAKDVKNYHVWSYRQWLVRHFSLWDTELPYVERLLGEDVRNNSAWNHRWFVVFARHTDPKQHSIKNNDAHSEVSLDIVEREIEYAEAKITIAPQNQSPWLYLKGVLRKQGRSILGLKAFAKQFADLANPDKVTSSHALDVLADVYAEEKDYLRSAQAFDLLASKKDNIRKNYWDYRRSKLPIVA